MSDPDQIRAEIEATRASLGQDVDALADKVTPSKIVDRQVDKVKGAFGSAKEKVMGATSDAKDKVAGATSDLGSSASSTTHGAVDKAKGSPLAVGLIAFGVGLLVASLVPASEKEKELTTQLKDAAQPLVGEVKDAAKEVGENLKAPAQDAAEALKGVATDAVDNVKSEAGSAKEDVQGDVEGARHAVADQRQQA
jgi:gas vesicle protein